ncbi:unnamed protein product [Acanthosepion pharaonis]|uniref:Uncharacterized protein n=1 Tax=Acanthosepion pharaonis TaxID=158019 RepID=A0A812DQ80_ACAPH|nr:unnamed protein product [Sepia pharaonis]
MTLNSKTTFLSHGCSSVGIFLISLFIAFSPIFFFFLHLIRIFLQVIFLSFLHSPPPLSLLLYTLPSLPICLSFTLFPSLSLSVLLSLLLTLSFNPCVPLSLFLLPTLSFLFSLPVYHAFSLIPYLSFSVSLLLMLSFSFCLSLYHPFSISFPVSSSLFSLPLSPHISLFLSCILCHSISVFPSLLPSFSFPLSQLVCLSILLSLLPYLSSYSLLPSLLDSLSFLLSPSLSFLTSAPIPLSPSLSFPISSSLYPPLSVCFCISLLSSFLASDLKRLKY